MFLFCLVVQNSWTSRKTSQKLYLKVIYKSVYSVFNKQLVTARTSKLLLNTYILIHFTIAALTILFGSVNNQVWKPEHFNSKNSKESYIRVI